MEWTAETNQKQPRECWNVKKNPTQEGYWKEKYKWNSDKKENISENSDKEKYKWKNDKIMKRPNAPWERRGVPLQRQDPANIKLVSLIRFLKKVCFRV